MSDSVWPHRRQPTRLLRPSLGFSTQEHWSGLPFPSPMHESGKWKGSCSVVSDSATPGTAAYQAPPSLVHHNYFEIHPCCMILIFIPVYCQVAFHYMDIPHLFMHSHVHGHLGVSSFRRLCSSFNSFRIKLLWTFLYKCFCRHSFNFSVKLKVLVA